MHNMPVNLFCKLIFNVKLEKGNAYDLAEV